MFLETFPDTACTAVINLSLSTASVRLPGSIPTPLDIRLVSKHHWSITGTFQDNFLSLTNFNHPSRLRGAHHGGDEMDEQHHVDHVVMSIQGGDPQLCLCKWQNMIASPSSLLWAQQLAGWLRHRQQWRERPPATITWKTPCQHPDLVQISPGLIRSINSYLIFN